MRPKIKNRTGEKIPVGLAITQAHKSPMAVRVGAVLFHGNDILNTGYNVNKVHDFTKKCSIHAEQAAFVGLRHDSIYGASMVVVRIGLSGDLLPATPCKRCMKLMRRKGVRVVYHWDTNLNMVKTYL